MNIRDRAISGVKWSAIARITTQALQLVLMILLMRLLLPEDFGNVAMLLVFIGVSKLFGTLGLGASLVQAPVLSSIQKHSIFWINLVLGLTLSTCFFMLAGPISRFYEVPILLSLTQATSPVFFLAALNIVPRAILQRNMHFDKLARIDMITTLLSGAVAVSIALLGGGVWALIAQILIYEAGQTLGTSLSARWRPRLSFDVTTTRPLLRYGVNLLGFNLINYGARNVDDLLIGKIFGSGGLGIYSRAYKLLLLPITQLISVASQVMFSTLSKIQEDRPRVKRIYLRATNILTFVSFPLMVGLFVTAEPFVLTVFGPTWSDLVPLIQIFAPLGIIQTLCNPVGWIYQSQGRTDWLFWWGIFGSGILILSIVLGVWLGSIESVAWAYLAGNVILFYPCIAIPGRLISMTFLDILRVSTPNLLCASVMGMIVFLLGQWIPLSWPQEVVLVVLVLSGMFFYGLQAVAFNLKAYREIKILMVEQFHIR